MCVNAYALQANLCIILCINYLPTTDSTVIRVHVVALAVPVIPLYESCHHYNYSRDQTLLSLYARNFSSVVTVDIHVGRLDVTTYK